MDITQLLNPFVTILTYLDQKRDRSISYRLEMLERQAGLTQLYQPPKSYFESGVSYGKLILVIGALYVTATLSNFAGFRDKQAQMLGYIPQTNSIEEKILNTYEPRPAVEQSTAKPGIPVLTMQNDAGEKFYMRIVKNALTGEIQFIPIYAQPQK